MKQRFGPLSLLFVFSLLFSLFAVPSSANSAVRYIDGMAFSDPLTRRAGNPVAVKGETLTFRPIDGWSEEGEVSIPDGALGTATAEYTLVNTSDAPVTLELAFPFGEQPYYSAGGAEAVVKIEKDGEPVPVAARLSWSPTEGAFSTEEALKWLSDEYLLLNGLTPDLPVMRLELEVPSDLELCYVAEASAADAGWQVIPAEYYGVSFEDGDALRYEGVVTPDGPLTFFFIGKTPEELGFLLRFFDGETLNSASDETLRYPDEEALPVKARECGRETCSLLQFAKWVMDERGLSVSDVDAYNAVAASFINNTTAFLFAYADVFGTGFLHWFVYELTFEPGQTLVNAVTVPLFPDVDESRSAPEYSYSYLLSPASGWKTFQDLRVVIETDMVLRSRDECFQETPTGYEASFERLPENELTFRLCRTKINLPRAQDVFAGLILLLFGGAIPVAVAALIVVEIVKAVKRRKTEREH